MEAQSLPYDVLKSVFECMSDGVAAFDEHGRILYCNPALAVLTGRSLEQLLGRTPMDAWGGRAASSYDSLTLSLSEERVVTHTGLTRHLSVRTVSLSEKGVSRVLLYRDVTRDKTKTIQRIQQSDERYRQLVETVRVIPWEMRPGASCFSYVGPQARKITGHATDLWYHDEFLRHVLTPKDLEQLQRLLAEPITPSESREFEFRMNSAYGTRLWFRAVASLTIDNELQPVIRGFLFDVTDLREAEERGRAMETRMLQSQKLESLGLLASGIAHDFNNLLMAILGNASLALLEMDESQKPHRFVKQVEVAATRASELTRELLNYSGKGRFVFKAVNLSSLVREMGELLQSVISKRATVRYEVSDKLPPVEADASQIRQVVMNLITNASDALGQSEGNIVIRTGTTRVTDAFNPHALLAENLRPGEYVFFEVEDTGLGMDEATRQRIFDPFFTTKAKGRGLGLSAVLGIIRSHKGVVILESRPGTGTRFRILLPPSGKLMEDSVTESHHGSAKVSGVVLVIDDEKSVVQVARDTLERIGLRVLTAEGGRQGLDLYSQHHKEIDVVLLDVVMPQVSGEDVCKELKSRDATLPILLSSGYNASDESSALQLGPTVDFIQKPYRPSDLQSKVRQLLNRTRRPQATAP